MTPGQTTKPVRSIGVLTGGDVPRLNAAIKALVYRSYTDCSCLRYRDYLPARGQFIPGTLAFVYYAFLRSR